MTHGLQKIKARYGTFWGSWHGSDAGEGQNKMFELQPGDFVSSVEGKQALDFKFQFKIFFCKVSSDMDLLIGLKFDTVFGSSSGIFGDGPSFTCGSIKPKVPANCYLTHFSGSVGPSGLAGIKFHFDCKPGNSQTIYICICFWINIMFISVKRKHLPFCSKCWQSHWIRSIHISNLV